MTCAVVPFDPGFKCDNKNGEVIHLSVAGVQGFEPQLADPESAVLPLNDTPLYRAAALLSAVAVCVWYDTPTLVRCQALWLEIYALKNPGIGVYNRG